MVQRDRGDGVLSGLRHTCAVASAALAGCVLLVLAAGLVSLGWQSNHVLAVVLIVGLLALAGYGVAAAMSRPAVRSRRRV